MAYSTIDKPSKYFNTLLWTGNGSSRNITGTGFDPNFVWIKNRSNGTRYHVLNDSVRGANKQLFSNVTNAEETDTAQLTAFITDGFSLGTNANVNSNGDNFVSWNWLANGTGVSNTQGSITSTVSANTTSGFSIVSYTSDGNSGATVGHGLGVAPSMIIVKRRSSAEDWGVGHKSLGWTKFIRLNTTGAEATSTGLWNDTAPSSTVVTLGNSGISNVGSGTTMIMYCFAEVKGFSKAFSYTGNGSTDGTFVYLGFCPAYVLIKYTSGTGQDWYIWDNKRVTYNPNNNIQTTNTSQADTITSVVDLDILSNGFKCRNTNGGYNASGGNYIGIAFAENPFVTSKGIPVTAK